MTRDSGTLADAEPGHDAEITALARSLGLKATASHFGNQIAWTTSLEKAEQIRDTNPELVTLRPATTRNGRVLGYELHWPLKPRPA